MSNLYFAYGSNMSTLRLQQRIPGAQPRHRARIDGFRLEFNKRGRDHSGKANLVEWVAASAWGVLFEITGADWPRLDRYEPGYLRTSCEVMCDRGRSWEAQIYLAESPLEHLDPFDWYHGYVLEGALEHGLPHDYIELLRCYPTQRGQRPATDDEHRRPQGR